MKTSMLWIGKEKLQRNKPIAYHKGKGEPWMIVYPEALHNGTLINFNISRTIEREEDGSIVSYPLFNTVFFLPKGEGAVTETRTLYTKEPSILDVPECIHVTVRRDERDDLGTVQFIAREVKDTEKASVFSYEFVELRDYSEYNSEKCHDGGQYGFWDLYTKIGSGFWLQTYHTTADFQFCEKCGGFNCDGRDCSSIVVTDDDLVDIVNLFEHEHHGDDRYQVIRG